MRSPVGPISHDFGTISREVGKGLAQSPAGNSLQTESDVLAFPAQRQLRSRLRAIAADIVTSWAAAGGPPAAVKSRRGLEDVAADICRRAGTGRQHVGWTMVAIVSEFWRARLGGHGRGKKVLLLPDCPAAGRTDRNAGGMPAACGPSCDVATIWTAARDSGWTVLASSEALGAIGGLLTGQYEGVLGVAELKDLQKAFSMLPCFALPIAAIPMAAGSGIAGIDATPAGGCPCGIDVDTALGFLGVAAGNESPMADYLPTLREAADMFRPQSIAGLCRSLHLDDGQLQRIAGEPFGEISACQPLDAAARLSLEFLGFGGKFLRPFIALASYDAILADTGGRSAAPRESAKAAAVAIEVFHKASLVHDDVEDDDAMRYARPTMHRSHGVASAVNAGDYLLGLGYRIIAALDGEGGLAKDLLSILSDAHLRLARGQGAELWWRDAADKRLSPAEALEIYGLKTSPAFEAALAMGVRLAGCRPSEAAALDRYALHVGTAFQVLNDLKDWSGDAENQRRAAGDLLGGRPTLLLAIALERLPPEKASKLLEMATRGGADQSEAVSTAAGFYEEADVFGQAKRVVARERRQAIAAIAACRLPRLKEVLEFLLDLAVPSDGLDAATEAPKPSENAPTADKRCSELREIG